MTTRGKQIISGCMRLRLCAAFSLLLACLLLSACATYPGGGPESELKLQWPPLPYAPRIVWVKEIKDYRDGGISQSFWKRIGELVMGAKDHRMGRPYGIFVDDRDRLYIIDAGASLVHVMDMKRKQYSVIGDGKNAVLRSPIGITGDGEDNVYITDSEASVVYRYSPAQKSLTPFITSLDRPTGIAFNRNNRLLYITDTTTHQVMVFDQTGRERHRIGKRGDGPGQFNYPTDLAIDAKGTLYVTDSLNARIETFSADGRFLSQIGKPGDQVGTFSKPKGVAADSEGHIYACDALFDTVQIFDTSGRVLLNFGSNGTDPGQFWMPSGLHIDRNDFIYVADSYNRRVQVFRYVKAAETALR